MELLVLTKSNAFLIGPIGELLGWIMDGIYNFFEGFGIYNIGLCIIVFTLLVNLIMSPLRIKQQKSSKLQAVVAPEMQAIHAKYKGKTDEKSTRMQQAELQNLYDKYGYSPTGGCLPLLIEMPIILALYQVIYRIPAYVSSVKEVFMNIVNEAITHSDFVAKISELATEHAMDPAKYDLTGKTQESINYIIDLFYKFDQADWNTFYGLFDGIEAKVSGFVDTVLKMNNFLGISLVENPQLLSLGILIPVLSALFQFMSTKLMSGNQTAAAAGDSNANMMKSMNTTMPIMSLIMCMFMPAGVGLYWASSSGIRLLQQLGVNAYMKNVSVEDIIKQNIEKQNKKRAKKGLPPIKQNASVSLKNVEVNKQVSAAKTMSQKAQVNTSTKAAPQERKASPGGIAAKAGMVKSYNEKNKK